MLASTSHTEFDNLIENCWFARTNELGLLLKRLCTEYIDINQAPINAMEWDFGRFKPIPPIVDAAVALYSGMDVFEIGHAGAAREDLEKTTNALVQSVLAASYARSPIISMQNNLLHNGRAWSWQDSGWPQYCPPSRN